ncbi:MAG: DUF3488 and transglutaminase-like domain-containing protein [Micrococcales bacterium]|nr:DUF3488 and transglutaminase-like domain-containing protein [Micrococcales bacterium]
MTNQVARRRASSGSAITVPLATAGLIAAVLVPMSGLVQGNRWVAAYLAAGMGVLLLGVVLRAVKTRSWLVALIQLLSAPLLVTYLTVRSTLQWWVFPTDQTWPYLEAMARDVGWTVLRDIAPINDAAGIVVLAALGGGFLAAVMDWYTHTVGAAAVAGLVGALPVVLAVAFVRQPISLWYLAVPVAAYLVLLLVTADGGASALGRQVGGAAGFGGGGLWRLVLSLMVVVLAVSGAQVVTGLAPEFSGSALVPFGSFGVGGGVSHGSGPLVDLGKDLRQQSNRVVAHYFSSEPEGVYLRTTTLDQFDGTTWSAGEAEVTLDLFPDPDQKEVQFHPDQTDPLADGSVEVTVFGPGGLRLPNSYPMKAVLDGVDRLVEIHLAAYGGSQLPLPWVATMIDETDLSFQANLDDLTLTSQDGSFEDQSYIARYQLPDLENLSPHPDLPSSQALERYLELPENLPPVIAHTASEAVAESATSLSQAQALVGYFTSGDFTYSTTAPVQQGFDGDSADVVATFLDVKTGYCIHFAAAMAVMARTLGLPSRVVLGYLPGSRDPDNGEGPAFAAMQVGESFGYTVRAHQLHSWTEVFIENVGWVAFEPTPASATAGAPPLTASPGLPGTQQRPREDPTPTRQPSPAAGQRPAGSAGLQLEGWLLVLTGGLLLALALVPALAGGLVRGRRLHHGLDGKWHLLRAEAADLGLAGPISQTPGQFGRRIGRRLQPGPALDALDRLIQQIEMAAYAKPVGGSPLFDQPRPIDESGDPEAQPSSFDSLLTSGLDPSTAKQQRIQARLVLRRMRAQVSRRQRWRARFWPRNQLRRSSS